MADRPQLDRRRFLRGAGAGALLGVSGLRPLSAESWISAATPSERRLFDFDQILDRRGTDCTKWDGAEADMGHAIEYGMGIADTDFASAPCITEAIAERCKHENWGYLRRPRKYVEAIADWNQRRYGLEVDPDGLVLTTGIHPALIAGLFTFAPPGSRVLMNTPTYNGFYSDLRFTRTIAEDSPMIFEDGKWSIDWDDFENRAARSHVFILCNPQNPTGNVWSVEELTRMGEICLRHDVIVLADEIHCDFTNPDADYTPFAALPDREIVDNSVTFKAASKSFNLAAMKISWWFTTNPAFETRIRANSRADLPTLGLVANHAALTEGEPWLDELRAYIGANQAFTERYIRENVPHVHYKTGGGTFLAWLDMREIAEAIDAKRTAAEQSEEGGRIVAPEDVLQRWIAKNAGVFLGPGDNFGTGSDGFMRMNLGTSRSAIQGALDNIAAAVATL